MNFKETYLTFAKLPGSFKHLEIDKTNHYLAFGMLRSKHRTMISEPVRNYFQGNIFQSRVDCESFLECKDEVIKSQGQVKELTFVTKLNISHLTKYSVSSFNDTILYTDNQIQIFNSAGSVVSLNVQGLLLNCTEPVFV